MEIIKRRNGVRFCLPNPHRSESEYIPIGAIRNPLPPRKKILLDLEIIEDQGSFFLKWLSIYPEYSSGDSWHKSLDEALRAGKDEFGIDPQDWDVPGQEHQSIFLFSGMGGDSRLFRELRVTNARLITPDYLEPLEGESLAAYAERMAHEHLLGPEDVVGGASFGGMVAAQIATDRSVAGLIMLASCFGPSSLPALMSSAEHISRWLPDGALKIKSWKPLVRWRFAPLTAEAEKVILAMGDDCPPNWLRRFARMIAEWPGVPKPSHPLPMRVIHGALDRMIPNDPRITNVLIPDAGHAFMLTHATITSACIAEFADKFDNEKPIRRIRVRADPSAGLWDDETYMIIEPEELNLPEQLAKRLDQFLGDYMMIIPMSTSEKAKPETQCRIRDLDRRGLELTREIAKFLGDRYSVRYFSDGLLKYIDS